MNFTCLLEGLAEGLGGAALSGPDAAEQVDRDEA